MYVALVQPKRKKNTNPLNPNPMNLTNGQSSKKQHLQSGASTACLRKTSGINNNDFSSFKWWAEKYPEICCTKCLNRFHEKANRINNR